MALGLREVVGRCVEVPFSSASLRGISISLPVKLAMFLESGDALWELKWLTCWLGALIYMIGEKRGGCVMLFSRSLCL